MKTSFLTISKTILLLLSLIFIQNLFAQTPQKMSYQAVIRNTAGALITNTNVGIKISLLQGTITGTVVYAETHSITTNTNGLASLEIGAGIIETGNFAMIDWANGPFFIKTETDPSGGNTYTITGTSQLLSVPYALLAEKAVKPTYPITASVNSNAYFSQTDRNIEVYDPNINIIVPETGRYLVNFNGYLINSNVYSQQSLVNDSQGTIGVFNSVTQLYLTLITAVVPFYDNDGLAGTIKYVSSPVSSSVIVNLIANDVLKLTYKQYSTLIPPTTYWGIASGGITIIKIGD